MQTNPFYFENNDIYFLRMEIKKLISTLSLTLQHCHSMKMISEAKPSERKAEEKRRKRARREEEIARSEKRRRTAVAATDDALREAEMRSRRRIQKLEIVAAVRLREARESKSKEEEGRRELLTKMRFDPSKWDGKLRIAGSNKLLWLRNHRRMHIDVPDFFKSLDG